MNAIIRRCLVCLLSRCNTLSSEIGDKINCSKQTSGTIIQKMSQFLQCHIFFLYSQNPIPTHAGTLTLDILIVYAHDLHGLHGGLELSHFINACHSDLALCQEDVVFGVLQDEVPCKSLCWLQQ